MSAGISKSAYLPFRFVEAKVEKHAGGRQAFTIYAFKKLFWHNDVSINISA
jgi:hypothetical protein